MKDQDLRKLTRIELLKMLIDQMTENEAIQAENKRLLKQLEDRRIDILDCGSIAEAAMKVNGVFQAAEAAAEQYLENARAASRDAENVLAAAREEAQRLLTQARQDAERLVSDAREEAESIMSSANRDSQEIREQAMQAWESFIDGSKSEVGEIIDHE